MTMITIMLSVTLHTIMSDQLKLFHNQPFSQAGIPPSTPEIIKLNIERENPVAPGSLTYQEMDVRASGRKEECDALHDAKLDTPQEPVARNNTRKTNQHGSHVLPPVQHVITEDSDGQVRQAESRHSTPCNSARGKNPVVLPRPVNMEVPTGPALERLTEFLAAISLATSAAVLALAIIAITCWALNS